MRKLIVNAYVTAADRARADYPDQEINLNLEPSQLPWDEVLRIAAEPTALELAEQANGTASTALAEVMLLKEQINAPRKPVKVSMEYDHLGRVIGSRTADGRHIVVDYEGNTGKVLGAHEVAK